MMTMTKSTRGAPRAWLAAASIALAALLLAAPAFACTTIAGSTAYHTGSPTGGKAGTTVYLDATGLNVAGTVGDSTNPYMICQDTRYFCMPGDGGVFISDPLPQQADQTNVAGTIVAMNGLDGYPTGPRQLTFSTGGNAASAVTFALG